MRGTCKLNILAAKSAGKNFNVYNLRLVFHMTVSTTHSDFNTFLYNRIGDMQFLFCGSIMHGILKLGIFVAKLAGNHFMISVTRV